MKTFGNIERRINSYLTKNMREMFFEDGNSLNVTRISDIPSNFKMPKGFTSYILCLRLFDVHSCEYNVVLEVLKAIFY